MSELTQVTMKYLTSLTLSLTLSGCNLSNDMTYEYMLAHQGETVIFRSKVAKDPEQHPTAVLDNLGVASRTISKKYEAYVALERTEGQIVLASDQPIPCNDLFETTGIVRFFRPDGISAEGKNSYERIWIEVISYKCL